MTNRNHNQKEVVSFLSNNDLQRQLQEQAWLLKSMMNAFVVFDSVFDLDGNFVSYRFRYINDAYERITDVKQDDVFGKTVHEVWPETESSWVENYGSVAMTGKALTFDMYHKPTAKHYHCHVYRPWETNERFCVIFDDITEYKRSEDALRESEQLYREIFNATTEAIFIDDAKTGQILDVNEPMLRMYGYDNKEEVLAGNIGDLSAAEQPSYTEEEAQKRVRDAADGISQQFEWMAKRKDGTVFPAEVTLRNSFIGGRERVLAVVRDITERKKAEEERENLQAQLNQAQKMESVGRLAGGVAHDFNNMLSVILGHAEIALEQLDPAQSLFSDLREIEKAAQRSADLTRQLLAFARKQTVTPKVLDLNDTVEGMLKLLKRLIGEDIDLIWKPSVRICPIKMDPSQIDQILANLCVNARDAIADIGKVTIETNNFVFDESYCAENQDASPGDYVMLAISDDGHGMTKETMSHLFEPFFTTKILGKGTGLGLATVYGIVKQNNGFINVYSEPGLGTTFRIYLPRHKDDSEKIQKECQVQSSVGGHETILLVEDEPEILNMTARMLKAHGYKVMTASTPSEAIHLAEKHGAVIDLLMTDMIMPEMNGQDLANKFLDINHNIKRLFMSGYAANAIFHHGFIDDKDVYFIQKPFSMKELADKLREVLDNK